MISKKAKEIVNATPEGKVLCISDFDIPQESQPALVKALNRLAANGTLQKVSKGRYYKPRQTSFGLLKPTIEEVVKDQLVRKGKIIGYITGTSAFSQMGLTTQISTAITIGTTKYRRPLKRADYTISFLAQPNAITKRNIPLLIILDALKLFRKIPATTPDDCIRGVMLKIRNLTKGDREQLCILAENYAPYVRALLGAILDNIEEDSKNIRSTLNGVSNYKLPISEQVLPTKSNWRII